MGERYSTQFKGTNMCSGDLENEFQLGDGYYPERCIQQGLER